MTMAREAAGAAAVAGAAVVAVAASAVAAVVVAVAVEVDEGLDDRIHRRFRLLNEFLCPEVRT